ncbi:ABC exporter membrane fusion protein [Synechococcus sp. PCC 6312]|uniref:ABC exporter membrane fusion protein n=1 Tax=Synechococcus sp. (strain ATCC 27167 / PCC 6312) TaxID=195253 RepID=UPI00029F206C|nr:ABC exporter membrane fusion protein [Synechococcus sp. PCC 6312]AFY60968.1 ABC exporter membrane fusion protein, DevB family [Synechococcus sp. PCC 6312]
MSQASRARYPQVSPRSLAILITSATLVVGGSLAWTMAQTQSASRPQEVAIAPVTETITALGRIEPQTQVIEVAAPTQTEGTRVEELLVQEGDWVKAGDVIATLDSYSRLQAAQLQAQKQVQVAQANLAKVRAGAKQGEIKAQQATIAQITAEAQGDIQALRATVSRLQAEVNNAEIEYQRHRALAREGAISTSLLDSKRLTRDTAQERLQEAQSNLRRAQASRQNQIQQAQATLDQIAEVRPVDIQVAQAEVQAAQANLKEATANFALAQVRAPQAGQVLKIHTWPGERPGNEGIISLGQTQQMYAVAEVYESDVKHLHPGLGATISSEALTGTLAGTVEQVGYQVLRQNVINTDPAANTDARIVEVRIKLDPASSQKAARYTNLQVKVVIMP